MNKTAVIFAILGMLAVTLVVACDRPPSAIPTPIGAPPAATAAPKPQPAATATPKPAAATATPTRPPAPAPSRKDYYQGKTIEIVVASAAGGPTDMAGRVAAAFYPQYLPGKPRTVVRNIPGGSGAVAMNNFVEKAKPDGFTLMAAASSVLNNQRLGLDIVRYDLRKVRPIASISRAESLLFIRKDALPRLTDPGAKPVVVGGREGTESWQAMPMWGRELLGWNVRWVIGFSGTGELELAMRRGEIDMFATADAKIPQRLVDDGVASFVAQVGSFEGGRWKARRDYPDVPVMGNLLLEKGISGVPLQAYIGWTAPGSTLDRWLGAPPGTPDDVMAILVETYKKMAADPKFDEMVNKTVTPVYTVKYGEEMVPVVNELLDNPPEIVQYPLQLQKKFGIVR